MMTEQVLMSDLAIPPGEYLEEILEETGLSQAELARRMGRPPQAINEILKGAKAITPETALQLERVVGVPAHIWNNLESSYRLVLAKAADEEEARAETNVASSFPYKQLSDLGLVADTRRRVERVSELRRFFAVSSLCNIPAVKAYAPAFRKAEQHNASDNALAAWLRAGNVLAAEVETDKFSRERLRNSLDSLRKLTMTTEPAALFDELQSLFARCGVALVMVPHFRGTYACGATFWRGQDHAVIMMSLRGSWSDIFWFSLLHEVGHLLLHGKSAVFLEGNSNGANDSQQETEADAFAQRTLVPKKPYDVFVSGGDYSSDAIKTFAASIAIFPGIVTGRLQHDGLLPHHVNHHRVRYKWDNA